MIAELDCRAGQNIILHPVTLTHANLVSNVTLGKHYSCDNKLVHVDIKDPIKVTENILKVVSFTSVHFERIR